MELILVVCLACVLGYIASQIHRSGQATEKLLEIAENAMRIRGGMFPAFSRREILEEMRSLEKSHGKLTELDMPHITEEYLGVYVRSGKGWRELKQMIERFRDARCVHEMHEETYNRMVQANLEVFHGKKSVGQAEAEVRELRKSYSEYGRRWVELSREEDKYLLWVRARFDKAESGLSKAREKQEVDPGAGEGISPGDGCVRGIPAGTA